MNSIKIVLLIFFLFPVTLLAEEYPSGMLMLVEKDSAWIPFVVKHDSKPCPVMELNNVRELSWNKKLNQIVYINALGDLGLYDLKTKRSEVILVWKKGLGYTGPKLLDDGSIVYLHLVGGRSRKIQIRKMFQDENVEIISGTRIYEPTYCGSRLNYVKLIMADRRNAHNVVEIRSLYKKKDELLIKRPNSISHMVCNENDKTLYFSSNQTGKHAVWKYDLVKKALEQVTYPKEGIDIMPAFSKDNTMYYIRKNHNGSKLMRKNGNQDVSIPLPMGAVNIRHMEISL